MRRDKSESVLRPRALALAVGLAFASAATPALANPGGATVVSGSATFAASGNTLDITNTPGAIIHWQQFSIGKDEITRFIQQNAASAVLNRVTGQNPSTILGQLLSNGRVFLINPSGIAFGQGALVDVAGLAASTLNLSDTDFLAGRMRFAGMGGEGRLTNAGTLRAADGGHVYLIAPNVENQASGVIATPRGELIIAAGNSVELVNARTPAIRVELTAPGNEALNAGAIVAASGRVGVFGTLIRNSGLVSASRAELGEGGKIVLRADRELMLEGGRVEAIGDQGGEIQLLGTHVGVVGAAQLDASGDSGGGTVLVGGDLQGANPQVQNAARTYVGSDATLKADALVQGDGGKVVVWADEWTRYYGATSAKGGAAGGNGGFVEVSGKQALDFNGRVDVGAPFGVSGTVLLDPQDIVVHDTTSTHNAQVSFADSPGVNFTISDESLEELTGNIVLQATRDITISSGLSDGLALTKQTSGERVVLQAGRDINIRSPLSTGGAALWLEADSPHAGGLEPDGVGLVKVSAGAPVSSNGGKITLIGGGQANPTGGFAIDADVNAGSGGINVSLTISGTLNFGIGAGGNTQLSSNDTGSLKTTGDLVLGKATTAGSDGLGTDAQELLVQSLSNTTASPIQLSPESGSSFQLWAGDGGITLSRPLTTYQSTIINTTGDLAINETLATSDNNLTIVADNVTLGASGSINIGSATFDCTSLDPSCTTLGVASSQVFWDGGGGLDHSWFNALNWSNNQVPDATKDVTIDTTLSFGDIVIAGGIAQAKSLIAGRPIVLTGELQLANASNFSDLLTLSGGTLGGAGSVSISGPSGGLDWTAGTMASGGEFLLSSGRSGTLSGSLTLDRLFRNEGFLTLSAATIAGSGALNNGGTLTAAGSTSNVINTLYANRAVDAITGAITLGTLQVDGSLTATSFPSNSGTINVASGGALAVPGSIANEGGITIDGTGSIGTLSIAAGSVSGTGDLSVTTDFTQSGGSLGTTFSDLLLTRNGDFTVGAAGLSAVDSIKLIASGDLILDGAVSATSGTGDAVVLASANFINNVGSGALDPGAGRWLVYSTNPAGNTFGDLVSGNRAIWGRSYPAGVSETGNRYVFSDTGAVTLTTTDASKTYGALPLDLSSNYTLSGVPVEAATFGDVYVNATVSDIFASDPSITSTGNTATAGVGDYSITASATPGSGYSLSLADSGLLTIDPAVLSVTANDAAKTYGETVSFTGSEFTSSGLQNGETIGSVTLASAGAAATANVAGSPYAIVPSAATGGTFDAGNYTITYNDGALTITARPITVASLSGQGKTYGDDDPLSAAGSYGLSGATTLVAGDSLGGAMGRVAGETVGAYAFTLGSIAVNDGNGGANYSLTFDGATHKFQIAPRALLASIADQSKIYGTNDPALAGVNVALSNVVARTVADINGNQTSIDDTAAVLTTLASLSRQAGENVGSYNVTGGTLATLSGAAAGNYSGATLDTTGTTLSITQAGALTGTIADQTKTYGTNDPALAGIPVSLSGLVNATVSTWNGSVVIDDTGVSATLASLSRQAGEGVGSYGVTGGTLNLGSANYSGATLDTSGNRLSITPATVTYVADPVTREAGAPNPPLTGGYTGLVSTTVSDWNGNTTAINDASAFSGSVVFTSAATESSAIGQYPVLGGGLSASNYVFVQAPENATALTIVEKVFSESLMNQVVDALLSAPDLLLAPASGDGDEDERRSRVGSQSCR